MATGGWGGYGDPTLLAQADQAAARRRGSVIQRVAAQEEVTRERELQRAVEAVLEQLVALGKIRCWYHRPDRATRAQDHEQRGLPDLVVGVRADLVLALELKTATGRVRPEQETWLGCWGERGALCRSLGEVLAHLQRWGVVG